MADQDGFVALDRSDGLGLSLPGGLCWPWEALSATVEREVREETGLQVRNLRYLFSYDDDTFGPMRVAVFRAEFSGTIRNSWEGRVVRVGIEDLRLRIMSGSQHLIQYLESETAPPDPSQALPPA